MRDRSYYIDDLNPPVGALVKCKASIGDDMFTPGTIYTYLGDFKIRNDNNQVVIPSARFQLLT